MRIHNPENYDFIGIEVNRGKRAKYNGVLKNKFTNQLKRIPFGQKGYSDYTKHKNKTRKQRYLNRHSGMGEHWEKPDTPGALSRWVLWNKPSLKASISDFKKRFKL